MNTTVSLVNAWAAFEEKHPDASIEEFCRHYLGALENSHKPLKKTDALMPGIVDSALMRMMSRIIKVHAVYATLALEGSGISSMDEFSLLVTIYQLKAPRKSEVIHACLFEISTGTDMLGRLRAAGYVSEQDDKEDKRSRRISLTAKGEKVLLDCKSRAISLAKMMVSHMDTDDKKLCVQLLKDTEGRFSPNLQQLKGRTFKEVYEEATGEPYKAGRG